ncbi:MAG: thioesterase family protein [Pseudomonadota bacterium]
MSTLHPFDQAMTLHAVTANAWRGETSDGYMHVVGPFGGFIAGVMLRAIINEPARRGDPVALTVNYCGAVEKGPFEIATKLQRGGKYNQHWSMTLVQAGDTKVSATAVFAIRDNVFSHQPATAPVAPAPEAVAAIAKFGLSWLDRYEYREIEGKLDVMSGPHDPIKPASSLSWIKDEPDRPLDYVSLASISDCALGRLVLVRGTMPIFGTVSLTTYFHATATEIAELGVLPVLVSAAAKRFHANFHDHDVQIWGKDGALIASGSQIVWYKE